MLKKQEQIFKALSDKSRIRILKMLQNRKLCVCEIRSVLGLANSTVSQHLSILKDAGLILDEKDGKWINYMINRNSESSDVKNMLLFIALGLEDDDTVKKDRQKTEKANRVYLCCK
jgi:ArsR family transcriptional regulator, arsenate/arsenite/antimonite-responsive transcriptional repressor